ncbi:hypothetical protein BCR44DRAFT_1432190 [Catenaria anguillulae PL171]|uniref:Ankyrin repeat-containing domain protein n=1 Tax=Catenaria anguillulae PL171 TaxID=765915 RepID=A0A1Y2HPP9_9FUNG|nr:hypothetical protein BCR44DRAFT_1432190 [Catenaria anguillulae PL171]
MQAGALEWWLDYCMLYFNGITTEVMTVLFVFGNAQRVAECLAAFLENGGFVHDVIPFACFSGSIEFIEKCLVQFDMVGEMSDSWVEFAVYASCAGHVHVLDWLHEKGWVDSSALNAKVSKTITAVWSIVPERVAAKLVNHLHDKFTLLDCLALQGFVHVMEWWLKFDKEAVQSHIKAQATRARNVEFAFAGNHVAFLDLLLTVFGQAKVDELHEVVLTQAIDWGHLEAIQWYWENVDLGGDHESMVWQQRDIMESIVVAAFAAEKLDIGVLRHRGLEWIVRNAARLGLKGQVLVKVCNDSQNQAIDFQLGPADLWALLGMIGHTTPDGSAKFVTAPFLVSTFLRHLLSCTGSAIFEYSQLLSDRDSGELLKAALPAGVAVYEWMYSYRDSNEATCMWTEEGHQFLMSSQDNCGLKWWKKRGLSTNSHSDDDGSQVQDGSESE